MRVIAEIRPTTILVGRIQLNWFVSKQVCIFALNTQPCKQP